MDKASLFRFITALAVVVNTILVALGLPIIPDEMVNEVIILAGGFITIYAMWKNNYLTKKGQAQKNMLNRHDLD